MKQDLKIKEVIEKIDFINRYTKISDSFHFEMKDRFLLSVFFINISEGTSIICLSGNNR
jgi:hypothetical protein